MASIEREVELALLNAVSGASIQNAYTSEREGGRLLPSLVAKASLSNEILGPFTGVFDLSASLTYTARADTTTRAGFDHEAETIIQELYQDPTLASYMTAHSNVTIYKASVNSEGGAIMASNRTWQRTIDLSVKASAKKESPAPPFSPTDISGLELWVKANAGVTLDGTNVLTWADQSGNNNSPSLDEYASGNPEFKTNEINGNPCVYFNKTRCFMGQGLNLSDWSVIHVAKLYYDEDSPGRIFTNTQIFGDVENILVGSWQNYNDRMYANGWVYEGTNDDYLWKITTGTCSTTSSQSYLYQNGSLLGGASASTPLNDYGIGGLWQLQNAERVLADVAEVLIYNKVLTNTERQQVESYLNTKYAIY